jgi:hypothetical protein
LRETSKSAGNPSRKAAVTLNTQLPEGREDAEDTLAFSVLESIRPMIETVPLEQAADAYGRMRQAGKAPMYDHEVSLGHDRSGFVLQRWRNALD